MLMFAGQGAATVCLSNFSQPSTHTQQHRNAACRSSQLLCTFLTLLLPKKKY